MSLSQAALDQLEVAGEPQTANQIWDALSAGGLVVSVKDPIHAIHWSLQRLSLKNKRLQFSDGQWWLKPPQAKKISRDAKIVRIKEGITRFKSRTGRWGAKARITGHQIGRFRELYDAGESVHAATRKAGISNAYFYLHRRAILAWKKNEAWPPSPKGSIAENADRRASASSPCAGPPTYIQDPNF